MTRPSRFKYDHAAVRAMWSETRNSRLVAEQFGCSRRIVDRITYDLRDKHGAGRVPPEKLAEAKRLLDERSGYNEAAKSTGIDWHTLARHFPGMGLTREETGLRSQMSQRFNKLGGTYEQDGNQLAHFGRG